MARFKTTDHPNEQIVSIISRIYSRGLTTTSGGNISVLDADGNMWVTPSGVDKGNLKPTDIMLVKKDGAIEGPHRPSSEYPFHRAIYNCRPDVKAIIHAHPPALVAFSIVRKIPDTKVLSQAKAYCGEVGYAPYDLPGSEALGIQIANEFKKGFFSVIMENHGTVVGGANLNEAFQRFDTLESAAATILYANTVGTPHYLSNDEVDQYNDLTAQPPLPEMLNVETNYEERKIRSEICEIVKRSCRQGLMISSYGIVSARWRDNDFLITPKNISRWDFKPEDIVQIANGRQEPGKIPSRMTLLHKKIYETFPHINSIIVSQPNYLMAFGITDALLNVRTIPESWIFLQDVHTLPFSVLLGGEDKIIEELKQNRSVLIQNNSFLVTGNKLLQTFDYLEVAEFSAKSIVMGASLGDLVPINDDQVEDLRRVFLKQ